MRYIQFLTTIFLGIVASAIAQSPSNQRILAYVGETFVMSSSEVTAGCLSSIVNWGYPPGNILRYGLNTTPGTTDMTTALQAAVNCNNAVRVPSGTYLVGSITLPNTVAFTLYGDGTTSILVQKASASPMLSWSVGTCCANQQGYIRDLKFIATAGTADVIHMVGVNGNTLQNLYFQDTPISHNAIFIDGSSSTYIHDVRLSNIQIYYQSANGGNAGIELGSLVSDSTIDRFQMNGGFHVSYCILADTNALTVYVSNSHIYNASTNIVFLQGGNNNWTFNGDILDNANNDLVVITSSAQVTFTGGWFEAVNSAHNALTLNSSTATSLFNVRFTGGSTTGFAVQETGSSNNTFVRGGNIGVAANWTNGIFSFLGVSSYASGVAGFNPLGLQWFVSGATTSAQAQNTTVNLGINGAQSSSINTEYVVAVNGIWTTAYIAVGSTPAAGQTFTFTAFDGATNLGSCTINNGSFTCTITVNHSVAATDVLYVQSAFSATSGSSNVRWSWTFTG